MYKCAVLAGGHQAVGYHSELYRSGDRLALHPWQRLGCRASHVRVCLQLSAGELTQQLLRPPSHATTGSDCCASFVQFATSYPLAGLSDSG